MGSGGEKHVLMHKDRVVVVKKGGGGGKKGGGGQKRVAVAKNAC